MGKRRVYEPACEERDILARLHLRGYRHSVLARALDVSPALVSMWFNGKRRASESHLIKLRAIDYQTGYRKLVNKNPTRSQ